MTRNLADYRKWRGNVPTSNPTLPMKKRPIKIPILVGTGLIFIYFWSVFLLDFGVGLGESDYHNQQIRYLMGDLYDAMEACDNPEVKKALNLVILRVSKMSPGDDIQAQRQMIRASESFLESMEEFNRTEGPQ